MAFYIRLDNDNEIELSTDLNLQERIKLCEDIIEQYPNYFRYIMPKNNKDQNLSGNYASMRLEIMGSYILDATEKDKDYPTLSKYKEKCIKNNEIGMNELEKYNNLL